LAKRLQEIDLTKELQRLIAIGQASPGSSHGDTFQTMTAIGAITPTTYLQRTTLDVSERVGKVDR
jgi:hypothetical protein